jgi:hypothetical protein
MNTGFPSGKDKDDFFPLSSFVEDPQLLDRLSPADFVKVAWYIIGARGYDITGWKAIEDGRAFRTFGFNLYTELASVVECRTSTDPVTGDVVTELQRFASRASRMHVVTLISRGDFSPSALIGARLERPIEIIDRTEILEWISDGAANNGIPQNSLSRYLARVNGSEVSSREFGRIVLVAGVDESAEKLSSQLNIPRHYGSILSRVEYFPLEAIQRISNDPRAMHTLTAREFEEFVAELVSKIGFDDVELTRFSGDGGRDIVARKVISGIPIAFFIECKKYAPDHKIQVASLRALLGVVAHNSQRANIGVLVTTSRFTRGSKELIAAECRLNGKDYDGIVGWLQEFRRNS